MNNFIPFSKTCLVGNELEYVRQAISTHGKLSGDGYFTRLCTEWLQKRLGARRALLTTSCTHALEMSALLLNIQQGDEIIMPSFSFVSAANAFVLRGGKPVFVDIREDTLNIDERLIEGSITPRTRAIVVVHYGGVACEMDAIMELATKYNLVVIEDSAHGLGGKYKGKYLGTIGTFGAFSFHDTKNITCGEGGALVINDVNYMERAEIIREKGTNRSNFYRGVVDKYTWVEVGSSYVLSELNAAFLWGQLEKFDEIQAKREEIWNYYSYALQKASLDGIRIASIPKECESTYHVFFMLMNSHREQSRILHYLKDNNIAASFHYIPLHSSPYYLNHYTAAIDQAQCQKLSMEIVRLPMYFDLNNEDQAYVVKIVKEGIAS